MRPLFSVLALFALPCAALRAAAPPSLPAGSYRLQPAKILDSSGFGRPMTAATLFIPAGWTATGGVVWQQTQSACGKAPTRFEWRAVAPDGLSAIEILPEENWSGNNLQLPAMTGACPNVQITTAQEYLRWTAGRVRPGARILDYRDRADLITQPELYNRTDRGPFGEIKTWAQAGEVLLAYSLNGRDVREALATIVYFTLSRMPGVAPGEIREFLYLSAQIGFAVRAPAGQLDFTLVEAVRRSVKADPAWLALMADHNQKMAGIAAKGAADRQAIRQKTAEEIAAINRQSYENTQATNDRIHTKFSQSIRGVETYVDPSSKERTELPNTHDHVWRLNDGSYLLTNDVNFQPNRDLGIQGQQLEVAK